MDIFDYETRNREYLKGHGLRLRAVEPEDAEEIWLMEADSLQWRECGLHAPFSRWNIAKYASGYEADPFVSGQLRLMIEADCSSVKPSSTDKAVQTVGIVDLYGISPENRTAFTGIYIAPEFRNRRIALNSLSLLHQYARDILNLRVLCAKIVSGNIESENLFKVAGYEYCGSLPDWILSGKSRMNLLLYACRL